MGLDVSISSPTFPPRRLRRSTSILGARHRGASGFTLIELVAVVTIITILMVIAVPGVARRLDSARAKEAGEQIATIYRSARLHAMGRGSAVMVRYNKANQTFQVLESVVGTGTTYGACSELPSTSCTTPAGKWLAAQAGTTYEQLSPTFEPGELANVTVKLSMPLSGALAADADAATVDLCFSPTGRTFISNTDAANPSERLTGIVQIDVDRDDGLGIARRIFVMPNGMARMQEAL